MELYWQSVNGDYVPMPIRSTNYGDHGMCNVGYFTGTYMNSVCPLPSLSPPLFANPPMYRQLSGCGTTPAVKLAMRNPSPTVRNFIPILLLFESTNRPGASALAQTIWEYRLTQQQRISTTEFSSIPPSHKSWSSISQAVTKTATILSTIWFTGGLDLQFTGPGGPLATLNLQIGASRMLITSSSVGLCRFLVIETSSRVRGTYL